MGYVSVSYKSISWSLTHIYLYTTLADAEFTVNAEKFNLFILNFITCRRLGHIKRADERNKYIYIYMDKNACSPGSGWIWLALDIAFGRTERARQ